MFVYLYFCLYSFSSLTFCELCGQVIWGVFRQGMQCQVCGVTCHRRCKSDMPNLCGVNQKLLAEALLVIKSQKHAARVKESPDPQSSSFTTPDKLTRSKMPLPDLPCQFTVDNERIQYKVFIYLYNIRVFFINLFIAYAFSGNVNYLASKLFKYCLISINTSASFSFPYPPSDFP